MEGLGAMVRPTEPTRQLPDRPNEDASKCTEKRRARDGDEVPKLTPWHKPAVGNDHVVALDHDRRLSNTENRRERWKGDHAPTDQEPRHRQVKQLCVPQPAQR